MKITIISGSSRPNSESKRVSMYLETALKETGVDAEVLDLSIATLPLYDDSKEGVWKETQTEIKAQLSSSDGFIFVSPEWDGMFAVGLHNLLHYIDQELADKPVLLVGVSNGRGGRYPLIQMRSMGYKNKHYVIIPESLFIDYVQDTLTVEGPSDVRLKERINYALAVLTTYAKALTLVRESNVTDYKKYKSGW